MGPRNNFAVIISTTRTYILLSVYRPHNLKARMEIVERCMWLSWIELSFIVRGINFLGLRSLPKNSQKSKCFDIWKSLLWRSQTICCLKTFIIWTNSFNSSINYLGCIGKIVLFSLLSLLPNPTTHFWKEILRKYSIIISLMFKHLYLFVCAVH